MIAFMKNRYHTIVILFMAAAGCSTRLPQTYLLSPGSEPASLKKSAKTLYVDDFTAASEYARPQFVYRTSPYRVHFDPVRRWAVSPEDMIRELVHRRITKTGLFTRITLERGIRPSDFTLRGHIVSLGETIKDKVRSSELALHLELLDKEENVLWSATKARTRAVNSEQFESVIAAISEGLDAIVDESAGEIMKVVK
jgi:ABC-type uncharacterized transport system auxiliary subunit